MGQCAAQERLFCQNPISANYPLKLKGQQTSVSPLGLQDASGSLLLRLTRGGGTSFPRPFPSVAVCEEEPTRGISRSPRRAGAASQPFGALSQLVTPGDGWILLSSSIPLPSTAPSRWAPLPCSQGLVQKGRGAAGNEAPVSRWVPIGASRPSGPAGTCFPMHTVSKSHSINTGGD